MKELKMKELEDINGGLFIGVGGAWGASEFLSGVVDGFLEAYHLVRPPH